jgi:hypothetical protein
MGTACMFARIAAPRAFQLGGKFGVGRCGGIENKVRLFMIPGTQHCGGCRQFWSKDPVMNRAEPDHHLGHRHVGDGVERCPHNGERLRRLRPPAARHWRRNHYCGPPRDSKAILRARARAS